jgi:DNA replication and repair protein RecF
VELATLTTRNFRNLASVDVEIPPRGVVVIGDNGQGKTNLLEAIYYLVLFRSLRGSQDRELVRLDRSMVDVGPAGRRRFLDVLLSLSENGYLQTLTELRAALRQRNAALKRGDSAAAQAFDHPAAQASHRIAAARNEWVSNWRVRYAELCSSMGEQRKCGIAYYSHHWTPHDGAAGIEQALLARIERDLRRGTTTVGPHRDDLLLTLGEKDLRKYGSAGQQRTAAIALRLLEAQALAESHGTTPIALFDDVFAELDQDRQERLLKLIGESLPGQAIITAPRDAEVPTVLFDRPRWRMTGGRLEE